MRGQVEANRSETEQPSVWRRFFRASFEVDLRSLAAFRVCLGVTLLLDLFVRAGDLVAHYTDSGVLPRGVWVETYGGPGLGGTRHWWSVHMLGGTTWVQASLFALAALAAICLVLGLRTRIVTVLSWILLLSLHRRNPVVINAGDVYLHCLLFWAMFLPLGAKASLDARICGWGKESKPLPRQLLSAGTVALLMQVFLMYVCTSALKNHPAWTREMSAGYYALHLDMFTTPLGAWLSQFEALLRPSTLAVIVLEWVGPFLALFPLWKSRIRVAVVALFWLLHGSIFLTMHVGLFSWICMIAWLPFLPSSVWDRVARTRIASYWRGGIDRIATWIQTERFASLHRVLTPRDPRRLPGLRLSRPTTVVVLLLLCYTALWNLREFNFNTLERWVLPEWANGIGRVTGLDQHWNMFAPYPSTDDGWYVLQGELYNGETVNLWRENDSLPWEKPHRVSRTYENQRWRKYLGNLYHDGHAHHREHLAHWLKRRWDWRHREDSWRRTVRRVEIHFLLERTPPPGEPLPEPEPRLLHEEEYGPRTGSNPATTVRVPADTDRD